MTKALSIATTVLLIASAVCLLLAIWAPGAWWQWLATGVVLFLAGAGCGGQADRRKGKR